MWHIIRCLAVELAAIIAINLLKGSVKEPNISIYFFFFTYICFSGVLFPMFCLLMEGKCQILVF